MKKLILFVGLLSVGFRLPLLAAPLSKSQKAQLAKDNDLVETARSEGNTVVGRQKIIRLLEAGANPGAYKSGAFSWSLYYGNFAVLNTFVKYHAPLPLHPFSVVDSENWNAPHVYRWLLARGAKPNFTDLKMAIQSQRKPDQLLKLLLDAGVNANAHGWWNYLNEEKVWATPLMVASQYAGTPGYSGPQFSDGRMIKALIAHGARINERTKDGRTALDFAMLHSFEEPVNARVLLQNGASVGKLAPRLLDVSASRNEPLIIDELDKRKLLPLKLSFAALSFPTGSGVVKRLLAHGANPDEADELGDTELHLAASSGEVESVRMLLDAGVNIEITTHEGKTPLFDADANGGENGNLAQQLLLERGANPNARDNNGATPLIFASLGRDRGFGCEKAVQLLCAHGADLTLKNNVGSTALHYAVTWSLTMVKTMLHANSSPEFLEERDANGDTAFLVAMASEGGPYMSEQPGNTMIAIAQALVNAGAKTDVVDSEGNTAFHLAGFDGEKLQFLHSLKPALSCDVPNSQGFTPLYIACCDGNVEAAYALLSFGANPDLKGKNGLSPRMVASQPFDAATWILSPAQKRQFVQSYGEAVFKQFGQLAKPQIDKRRKSITALLQKLKPLKTADTR